MKTSGAIVFHGGGRRWFSAKAAARAEAKKLFDRVWWECRHDRPVDFDYRQSFIARYAKRLLRRPHEGAFHFTFSNGSKWVQLTEPKQ